jgi:quinolinate synthase
MKGPAAPGHAGLVEEIGRLKQAAGALVLAHNYQQEEIYEIADFIGDSLELARKAAESKAGFIVFCGVRFMAETAKLLNPGARVVLAEPGAGCQMADMISAPALRARKAELGNPLVIAYVNTPVDVKAEADVCCTSANAVAVVRALDPKADVLFVPDRNLARYAKRESGRSLASWPGFCYVHASFTAADVARARAEHPAALVVAHPECPLEVIDAADRVASTGGMYALAGDARELVLGTEAGMCGRIRRDFPATRCYPLRRTALCRNMKLTRLEHVRRALTEPIEEITVPDEVAAPARKAIERMLEI